MIRTRIMVIMGTVLFKWELPLTLTNAVSPCEFHEYLHVEREKARARVKEEKRKNWIAQSPRHPPGNELGNDTRGEIATECAALLAMTNGGMICPSKLSNQLK